MTTTKGVTPFPMHINQPWSIVGASAFAGGKPNSKSYMPLTDSVRAVLEASSKSVRTSRKQNRKSESR